MQNPASGNAATAANVDPGSPGPSPEFPLRSVRLEEITFADMAELEREVHNLMVRAGLAKLLDADGAVFRVDVSLRLDSRPRRAVR